MSSTPLHKDRRIRGTVKFFHDDKGYGFIDSDVLPGDAFVHHSSILMDGFKTLQSGQRVTFSVIETEKGFKAENVHPHDTPEHAQ